MLSAVRTIVPSGILMSVVDWFVNRSMPRLLRPRSRGGAGELRGDRRRAERRRVDVGAIRPCAQVVLERAERLRHGRDDDRRGRSHDRPADGRGEQQRDERGDTTRADR
jgi:hypothetical protein